MMTTYQDQKAIQLTKDLREYLLQVGVREPACLKNTILIKTLTFNNIL